MVLHKDSMFDFLKQWIKMQINVSFYCYQYRHLYLWSSSESLMALKWNLLMSDKRRTFPSSRAKLFIPLSLIPCIFLWIKCRRMKNFIFKCRFIFSIHHNAKERVGGNNSFLNTWKKGDKSSHAKSSLGKSTVNNWYRAYISLFWFKEGCQSFKKTILITGNIDWKGNRTINRKSIKFIKNN